MKGLLIAILLISSLSFTNTFAEKESCSDGYDVEFKIVDQFKNETKFQNEASFIKFVVKISQINQSRI